MKKIALTEVHKLTLTSIYWIHCILNVHIPCALDPGSPCRDDGLGVPRSRALRGNAVDDALALCFGTLARLY
jgi:hypothetical protein